MWSFLTTSLTQEALANSSPAVLTLNPDSCKAPAKSVCTIDISWSAPIKDNYCVYMTTNRFSLRSILSGWSNVIGEQVKCWIEDLTGEVTYLLTDPGKYEFILIYNNDEKNILVRAGFRRENIVIGNVRYPKWGPSPLGF